MNREVIAVNQDPLGCQAFRVGKVSHGMHRAEVWAKPLADGSIAVGLFNLGDIKQRIIGVAWETVGLHDRRPCRVRDLWKGEELGVFTGDFTTRVARHDVKLLRLTPIRS
jgi:alpha-galactosidase